MLAGIQENFNVVNSPPIFDDKLTIMDYREVLSSCRGGTMDLSNHEIVEQMLNSHKTLEKVAEFGAEINEITVVETGKDFGSNALFKQKPPIYLLAGIVVMAAGVHRLLATRSMKQALETLRAEAPKFEPQDNNLIVDYGEVMNEVRTYVTKMEDILDRV